MSRLSNRLRPIVGRAAVHNQPGTRRWLAQLLVASLVLGLLGGRHPLKVQAQGSQAAQAATVHTDWRSKPEGMHFAWQTPGDSEAPTAAALTLALAQLTPVQYGGYRLPMGLQTVILADDVAVTVQLDRVIAQPWQTPSPAEPVTPALLDREPDQPAEPETLTLPAEPLFVLREGRVRGQRVAVIAFSPLYQQNGETQVAVELHAFLPGAQPLTAFDQLLAQPTVGAWGGQPPPPGPTNAAALTTSVKVVVAQAGLQRITGAALITAGLPAGARLENLQLRMRGQETAIEVHDADGQLDHKSELRFYAPASAHSMQVGDRWNQTTTYWLTVAADPGLRMVERSVMPGEAPVRSTAFAHGIWEDNRHYESTMAGVDGDHWFAAAMFTTAAGAPADEDRFMLALTSTLPIAADAQNTAAFTITGSARTVATYHLRVDQEQEATTFTWTSAAPYTNWRHTVTSTQPNTLLALQVLPDEQPSDLWVDKVYWRLPVTLDLQAGEAQFSGVAGSWRYLVANPPTLGALYDISEPLHPQVLTAAWGNELIFEDGPEPREYLVTGPGKAQVPTLLPHQPIQLAATSGADVVYIAPAHFFAELAPLVTHRQAQGYQVALVDVQAVYDGWGDGQVDPAAIRSFLRYAVSAWQPSPIAAILVGDGTFDPRNYLGLGNPNVIPPYLAAVDPWIGEAACENCYAQLDGDYPLGTPSDPGFLIDLWIGRLSVQNTAQLRTVVDKLIRYETGDRQQNWSSASLYVADNYIQADGTLDGAGDFAFFQDLNVVGDPRRGLAPHQSSALPAVRLYYDPRPGGVQHEWREPDAALARLRVIDAWQQGPQLVVYNGHGNQHQWASTVRSLPEPYLLGTNDVAELHNLDRLAIVLAMTCLTGQFADVSTSGATLDERFLRQDNGGAAAVWSSTGLTVIYGQEALMRGFHHQLWSRPPGTARLGELVEAGYFALFGQQGCCQSTSKVYLLFGDPLTPARIMAPVTSSFLPFVRQ